MKEEKEQVFLGEIVAPFGIKGWVKIYSHTDPPEQILAYRPWILVHKGRTWQAVPLQGKRHGRVVIAQLEGVADRNRAEELRGTEIYVERAVFPPTDEARGEFYWHDLIGMEVLNLEGKRLGRVVKLIETGANDVLVVQGEEEILIPWLWQRVIKGVDKRQGVIRVSWSGEFQ